MWAKHLFVAGFAVLSVAAAPIDAVRQAYTGDAQFVLVQDRRGERAREIRSVREVADQVCQLSRGGELLSARLEDGPRPVYVLRCRMPNGEVRDFRVDASR